MWRVNWTTNISFSCWLRSKSPLWVCFLGFFAPLYSSWWCSVGNVCCHELASSRCGAAAGPLERRLRPPRLEPKVEEWEEDMNVVCVRVLDIYCSPGNKCVSGDQGRKSHCSWHLPDHLNIPANSKWTQPPHPCRIHLIKSESIQYINAKLNK